MSSRLWQYGLTGTRTAGAPFLPNALDARAGDVVRLRDKLHVGLCLGVRSGTATVRWAWQRNTSVDVPMADLERQRRSGE